MSQFAAPAAPSGGVNYDSLHKSLLLIEVLAVEEHVPTVHSTPGEKSPAIRASVTVLDGSNAGEVHEDTLIFPKVLQSQLRSRVGQLVLGRLTQGMKKPGQNAPWQLEPATADDVAVADAHMRKATTPTVQSAQAPF